MIDGHKVDYKLFMFYLYFFSHEYYMIYIHYYIAKSHSKFEFNKQYLKNQYFFLQRSM
jgi:hypothetical protein